MKPFVLVLCFAFLAGCGRYQSEREVQVEAKRRQQSADVAATIWEAADAIEKGAPTAAPTAAIKAASAALISSEGATYSPAKVTAKETP